MAFIRYFRGQDAINTPSERARQESRDEVDDPNSVRSELRYFTRLTLLASWRSEYLLRIRLLRNVARGKPSTSFGSIGSTRAGQSGKRASAVLTYNSKLPWVVTNLHAVFSPNGKKQPRVISGAAELGVGTVSDPTTGKVEKWGLDDPFSFGQLDEMFPNLSPYGLGDGPAAVPNVMDVSPMYGVVGGGGFPGGRPHYRGVNEVRGRYLGQSNSIIDMVPEIPKIPEMSEAICSVWIAKSAAVPSATQSMVGIMTGSTLGIVTTYAIKSDSAGPRFSNGDITARWALSPGVPIVGIRVDDNYSTKRKVIGRVLAVVLNALGEVFYLKEPPTPPTNRAKSDDLSRAAWTSGRSVSWELIEATRRRAHPDDDDKNAVRGTYSPRSHSDAMNLSKEQVIAESREIEKFLRHTPAHFRRVCDGWDMRRRLEVDFAGGDEDGSAENIVVITCGREKGEPVGIVRYTRHGVEVGPTVSALASGRHVTISPPAETHASPSIFSGPSGPDVASPPVESPREPSPSPGTLAITREPQRSSNIGVMDDWRITTFTMKHPANAEITTSNIDLSMYAVLASFEDPLQPGPTGMGRTSEADTSAAGGSAVEIPGRRSRLFAIGTNTGLVVLWDVRAGPSRHPIQPLRVIQTESPEISCLALSALYVVHGSSDGQVQIWDPLASTPDAIRTLSSRSSGRVPRHIINANPTLSHANYSAVGAIFLDPDPTVLRGVLAFGTLLRYWTYSSTNQLPGRKRRLRHSDAHGRPSTRRHGGAVSSYIAAETAELRREQEHRSREQTRLRNRFGVGLGDLTEEEAIRYAQMVSEEAFLLDEQRRLSASDTGSAADAGETASSAGSSVSSADTVTPEPSLSGVSPPAPSLPVLQEETDDDYEAQIQRAIRLSLMEGVNDVGQSPRGNSSGDYDFPVKVKDSSKKKNGKRSSASTSPTNSRAQTPMVQFGEPSGYIVASSPSPGVDPDEDLELALRLSLAEQEGSSGQRAHQGPGVGLDEFPPLS